MEELERNLKEMIISRYGNLSKFCESVDMPWTTLDSILKRGVSKSNIGNVIKISSALNIDIDKLANGEIVPKDTPSILAAHFTGDEYTEAELEEIYGFAEFVRSKRKS